MKEDKEFIGLNVHFNRIVYDIDVKYSLYKCILLFFNKQYYIQYNLSCNSHENEFDEYGFIKSYGLNGNNNDDILSSFISHLVSSYKKQPNDQMSINLIKFPISNNVMCRYLSCLLKVNIIVFDENNEMTQFIYSPSSINLILERKNKTYYPLRFKNISTDQFCLDFYKKTKISLDKIIDEYYS